MSDNGAAQPPVKPRIVIEFPAEGAADCTVQWSPNLTSGQLYVAAFVLASDANDARARERLMPPAGISIAPKDALDILERLGIKLPGADAGRPTP